MPERGAYWTMGKKPDAPALTVGQLERQLTKHCLRGGGTGLMSKMSGARRFTFYWFRDGKRLAVKSRRVERPAHDLVVEALAAKLEAAWTCPECSVKFVRRGRQRYCTPAHAARARKRRWQEQPARAARRAYLSDLRARHVERRRALQPE